MRLAGRAAAAIDILKEVFERHRPVSEALKDWGKAHRFAGSTDRHAIGTLVYDGLRRRNSLASRMGDGRPRALVLAALRDLWGMSPESIAVLAGEAHGPGALTEAEVAALSRATRSDLPVKVRGELPDWLVPAFEASLRGARGRGGGGTGQPCTHRPPRQHAEGQPRGRCLPHWPALAPRPVPCRRSASAFRRRGTTPATPMSRPNRPMARAGTRCRTQASQVAALLSGAAPGETVADICAGAGGKTLALAAMMQNEGRLVAHDTDRFRLRPIFERLQRAGVTNCEVISAQDQGKLEAAAPFDCVVIDAPCSGSGSWRRKPDAKWRLTRNAARQASQGSAPSP